jgi:hypothetical protein
VTTDQLIDVLAKDVKPCPDEFLPRIALWYYLSIGICAGAGAARGPSVLRW